MLDRDGGLLRGTLDLLILKSLSWGPRHGYAVAEWIKSITDDELLVVDGPLYTALHRLESRVGSPPSGASPRTIAAPSTTSLSRSGRQQLRAEATSWDRYAAPSARRWAPQRPATA